MYSSLKTVPNINTPTGLTFKRRCQAYNPPLRTFDQSLDSFANPSLEIISLE
jgi:hypothetical protein